MNKYREERINMIIAMMMAIANISEEKASELLKSTITYQNIIAGEECTLYESYSANLEDAVEELMESDQKAWVEEITEDAVTKLNKRMLDEGIKNAKQLKDSINAIQTIIIAMPSEEMIDQEVALSTKSLVSSLRERKVARTQNRTVAFKKKTTVRCRNKAGRVAAKRSKDSTRANRGSSGRRMK